MASRDPNREVWQDTHQRIVMLPESRDRSSYCGFLRVNDRALAFRIILHDDSTLASASYVIPTPGPGGRGRG